MASIAKQRLETLSQHMQSSSTSANIGNDENVRPKFELEDHPVDEVRSLKVAVIGAGISGITAGILVPAKVPGIDLTIYEKNADVGGTWFENTYPGVRCDIPSHVYQSSFSPSTQWTEEFGRGAEILSYWKSVAQKHNVYPLIKFKTKITRAAWDAASSKWVLTTQNVESNEISEEKYDILITAIGRFNAWKLPDIEGIENYEGHLRHSSNWDPSFDPTNKIIAVIGNGASGIQIVPELQKAVKRLDHYARSKTWIAGSFAGHERKAGSNFFDKGDLEKWGSDEDAYLRYRKGVEEVYWRRFAGLFKGSGENEGMRREFEGVMKRRLGVGEGDGSGDGGEKRKRLAESLIPDFAPNCRRLTPGPGYLEALTEENVDFIQSPIKRLTRTGIETVDGVVREVDAIICSTGANVDYAPPFSIVVGGVDLKEAWKPNGEIGFPYSYLGVATPGFPNLLFLHGPNTSGPSGTLPNSVENQVTYLARLLRKVSREGIRSIVPKKEAADDFVEYCDTFFSKTVLSENCSSWANGGIPGGRIHGHWPGSAAHTNFIRRSPRWEDFDYELDANNRTQNRFAYWGNGWTSKQLQADVDLTSYLKRSNKIDLKDLHESWWEV